MATKIAIEAVYEAEFRVCSYDFRLKRSAKQALEDVVYDGIYGQERKFIFVVDNPIVLTHVEIVVLMSRLQK